MSSCVAADVAPWLTAWGPDQQDTTKPGRIRCPAAPCSWNCGVGRCMRVRRDLVNSLLCLPGHSYPHSYPQTDVHPLYVHMSHANRYNTDTLVRYSHNHHRARWYTQRPYSIAHLHAQKCRRPSGIRAGVTAEFRPRRRGACRGHPRRCQGRSWAEQCPHII